MKTDNELGQRVARHLKNLNIETPMISGVALNSHQECVEIIQSAFRQVLSVLGLNLADDSLKETPARIAKMYVYEIFEGLDYANFPKCTTVENKMKYDEMVIVDGVNVASTCEHHFQTIDGNCKVAYIPKDKVLGLSKINRIVRFFSKRPQIQERLTEQIHAALVFVLETENIAVEIKAVHHCVKARGIEDKNSITTTRRLGGKFMDEFQVRNEFLNS